MSRRLDVLNALLELFRGALPDADVDGLGDDEEAPTRVGSNGSVTLHAGDPGDPEIDLSPLTYNWTHSIPVEVIMANEAALDVALGRIGAAIDANRQLGGLCDWIDVGAPATEPVWMEGADPMRGAPLVVTAIYATSNPLT